MTINNQKIYSSNHVAEKYKRIYKLTKPENVILELVNQQARKEKMLDIGIGAGRTTLHFAPLFKEYTGIDYSKSMLEVCRNNTQSITNADLYNLDARKMDIFKDNEFDFVLFSFNGIDCVSDTDRISVFREIHRVAEKNSFFAFSTHNIYNIPLLFSKQIPKNPLNWYAEYKRIKNIRKYNISPDELVQKNYAVIIDGDIDFSVEYYYIKPEEQIKQLHEFGFYDVQVFSLRTGNKLTINTDWKKITDPWLYYLCKVGK